MFACASYELTDDFEENISAEIRQNMRRLRSHASIDLWCGNNEMETQYETLAWQKSKKQTYDYIHLYEYIIPKSSKKRIRRNSTGRHPRLQAEITKTAMQRTSAIPITGVYGTEASRSPLIVPTITVSCPSSDSSPSRHCRL